MRSLNLISILSACREDDESCALAILDAVRTVSPAVLQRVFEVALRSGELDAARGRSLLSVWRSVASSVNLDGAFAVDDAEIRRLVAQIQEVQSRRDELLDRDQTLGPVRDRLRTLETRHDVLRKKILLSEAELASLESQRARIGEIRNEVLP